MQLLGPTVCTTTAQLVSQVFVHKNALVGSIAFELVVSPNDRECWCHKDAHSCGPGTTTQRGGTVVPVSLFKSTLSDLASCHQAPLPKGSSAANRATSSRTALRCMGLWRALRNQTATSFLSLIITSRLQPAKCSFIVFLGQK